MRYAKRVQTLKPDDIREMIKLTAKPGIISFAVGNPAVETFPIKELIKAARCTLEERGGPALMYHDTRGYLPLREKMAARIGVTDGIKTTAANVMITTGSQQGIDLCGKIFVDEGDIVLIEKPTYSGGINALKTYLPRFIAVSTDEEGIVLEELENIFRQYGGKVKLIYVIPSFHNPSGRTWSLERREKFVEIITRYQVPVAEDCAYTELCFTEERLPALKTFDTADLIVYLGSFAKTIAPGLRCSYICASNEILTNFVYATEGAYLQASTLIEMVVDKYLELFDYDEQIRRVSGLYKKRCAMMLSLMDQEFPPSVKFTRPAGGMFTWIELPRDKDSRELFNNCLKENVAFLPGSSFYPVDPVFNTMRLCYASADENKIEEGMRRLGKAMRNFLKE